MYNIRYPILVEKNVTMKLFVKKRRFYKAALFIALPIEAQQVINFEVNLMDSIMLGSFGGIQISGSSKYRDLRTKIMKEENTC